MKRLSLSLSQSLPLWLSRSVATSNRWRLVASGTLLFCASTFVELWGSVVIHVGAEMEMSGRICK